MKIALKNPFKKWFAVVCFKDEWQHLWDVGHYIVFVLSLIQSTACFKHALLLAITSKYDENHLHTHKKPTFSHLYILIFLVLSQTKQSNSLKTETHLMSNLFSVYDHRGGEFGANLSSYSQLNQLILPVYSHFKKQNNQMLGALFALF